MIKIFKYALPLFSIILFVFIAGCSKSNDSSNPTSTKSNPEFGSVTLNGGGYNNVQINFVSSSGGYSISNNMSYCVAYGMNGSDTVFISLGFNGKNTGDYSWEIITDSSTNYSGLTITFYNSLVPVKVLMSKAGGKTTVSNYGSVGQYIEGTFSGTTYDSATNDEVTVTGSFNSLHAADE